MKVKKLSLIICLALLLYAFTACSKNEKTQTTEWESYSTTGFKVYKDGVFFSDDNTILHYFDASSKEDVILCDKKDCQHSDSSCHGYIGSSRGYVVSGEHIYTLNNNDSFDTLIESNIDYTNHKETVSLGKALTEQGYYISADSFLVSGDYLYYLAQVSNFDTGDSYYGIYGINIKTGKETTIADRQKSSSDLNIVSVCGPEIIYFTSYLDEELSNQIYGLEQETIDWEQWNKKFKEIEEQRTYSVYRYNMETGETTVFYENKTTTLPLFANENSLYCMNYTIDETSYVADKYFTVNQKTQEEKDVTEDEYYKAFRGYTDSEKETITGGNEDLNIYCLVDSGYIGARTDKKIPTGENSYTITGKSYVLIDKNNPQKEPFVFYTLEK